MEQIACPVCTLYLREGMTLQRHLYTHPKAQVIDALARLAGEKSSRVIERRESSPDSPDSPEPQHVTSITYHHQQILTGFVGATPTCIPPPPPLTLLSPNINRGNSIPPLTFMSPRGQLHHQQQQQHPPPPPPPAPPPPPPSAHPLHEIDSNSDHNLTAQIIIADNNNFQSQLVQNQHQEQHQQHFVSNIANSCLAVTANNRVDRVNRSNNSSCHRSPSSINSNSPMQYTQLENMNFDLHHHESSIQNSGFIPTALSNSILQQNVNEDGSRDMMNIGTMITDSQRIISNSPTSGTGYISDPNKSECDDASPSSPASMTSTVYSVRVRKDLSENDTSPIHLTSPRNEYIIPGFDYGDGDDVDEDGPAMDNSTHSIPLNIHTDESMPPRGELSGHGTDSGSIWQQVLTGVGERQNVICDDANNQPAFNLGVSTATNVHITQDQWKDCSPDLDPPLKSISIKQVEKVEKKGKKTKTDKRSVTKSRNIPCTVVEEREQQQQQQQQRLLQLHHQQQQVQLVQQVQVPSNCVPVQDTFSNVFVKPERVRVIPEEEPGISIKTDETAIIKTDDIEEKPEEDLLTEEKPRRRRPPRTCRTCDETFPTAEDFRYHIGKVHPLECKSCGKCFFRMSGLNLHQRRHLKVKPCKCDLCDKTFITNQKLREHRYGHTGDAPLKCLYCDRMFRRHSNLIQHKRYFHFKNKRKVKDFYCFCGEVFHSQRKLHWHQETHDEKPKQCMYCSERYAHSSSLTRHIRRAHDENYIATCPVKGITMENVKCPVCHKVCLKGSLRNHMLIHSGLKPFSCTTCGKRFRSKWNMKLHRWTHASRSSKPFKCKQCKAAFIRETDFQIHMRSHKNIRPYSCNHCGRQFVRKYNCIRHTREHEMGKKYKCEICQKMFHRSYYLKEHMRTHTGLKPYSCHICSKTTATKTNHNKHLKTHHAREPVNSEN